MINSPCSKNIHLFLGIIHLLLLHWFSSNQGDASLGEIAFWERKHSQSHRYYSLLINSMVDASFVWLGACGAESDPMGTSFVNWHWCGHHLYIAGGKGIGCGDRAQSGAAHWEDSASQLPGEGDEHGKLNQQNHLPCLGQESLSCYHTHPHCPYSSSFVTWPGADSNTNGRKGTQGAGKALSLAHITGRKTTACTVLT